MENYRENYKNIKYTTPLRFSTIENSLYRGGYPTLRNFRFLRRLQLKTIISLTPEVPTADLNEFCRQFGIINIHIQVSRLSPLNSSLQASLIKAINIVIDQQNLPIYIHCLDGRRITGLFVLLLRRLQGYIPEFSSAEFWRFQSFVSASYGEMERSSRDLDKFVNDIPHEILIPLSIPKFLWDGDRNYYVSGLKLRYLSNTTDSNDSNMQSSQSLSNSSSTSQTQSKLSLIPSSISNINNINTTINNNLSKTPIISPSASLSTISLLQIPSSSTISTIGTNSLNSNQNIGIPTITTTSNSSSNSSSNMITNTNNTGSNNNINNITTTSNNNTIISIGMDGTQTINSTSVSSTPTSEILRSNDILVDGAPRQRRPSQARMTSSINSNDDLSSDAVTARQLAALDLALHRYTSRS